MTNMKSLIFYPLLSVANELLKEPILNNQQQKNFNNFFCISFIFCENKISCRLIKMWINLLYSEYSVAEGKRTVRQNVGRTGYEK
jgi:hypothetical protein